MSDHEDTSGAGRRHLGPVVEKEIAIDATPKEVWEAWAEPEGIARWFVDRAEGRMEAEATVTWIFETFGYRSWPELDGVLGLKGFRMEEHRAVALDFSAWPGKGAGEGVSDEVRRALDRAIGRLAAAVGS